MSPEKWCVLNMILKCSKSVIYEVLYLLFLYICTPPGSAPSQLVLVPSGSRTRDAGAGGGRSTKEAKGYNL